MRRALCLCALGLALAAGAAGCGETDPSKPEFWLEKLKTEQRQTAIKELGRMGKKAQIAVDPLISAFKDGRDRYEIVTALTQIGDHKAIPVMLEALQDKSNGKAAQLAASTLKDWGAKEHGGVYIAVAADKTAPKESRYGALVLLAEFPDPKTVQPLLQILDNNPELDPIVYNGLAAESLGKLKAEEAVPGLVRCLWLDDPRHRNEVPACRLALNRIGSKAAVPELITTLEGKNREVWARARKYQYDKGGLIQAKAAELLGDMPDASAVEPLIKELNRYDAMPPSFQNDPQKSQFFVMSRVQKAISICNALAVIGDERAVDPMVAVAADPELALEHKLAAVQQLGFLGSQKAIDGLMKLYVDEPHPEAWATHGFQLQIALNLANLMDGKDEKAIDALEAAVSARTGKFPDWQAAKEKELEGAQAEVKTAQGDALKLAKRKVEIYQRDVKGFQDMAKSYEEVTKKLAVLRECKDQLACWGKKLADPESAVRMTAAYHIAQMKDQREAAQDALIPYVDADDLDFRNVVLFGLDRIGDKKAIPALEKAAEKDEARKSKKYAGAVYTSHLMIAKLSHR